MPEEVVADTHGVAVAGASATVAGDTIISAAAIVLPAGGPWTIFRVWGYVAAATRTAAQAVGGYFRINAKSGDISPNPAPSKFPTGLIPSYLGATADVCSMALAIHDVEYEASGKAEIELIYNVPVTIAVAEQVVLGMIFGKTRPVMKPLTFVDRVRISQLIAVDTLVGTITISEKAERIVAICGMIAQNGVLTTAEELIGFFRLASDDIKLPPANYPFNCAFSAGLGALINPGNASAPEWIPVIIPVVGGARIDCFVDLNTAVTAGAEVVIYIAYE